MVEHYHQIIPEGLRERVSGAITHWLFGDITFTEDTLATPVEPVTDWPEPVPFPTRYDGMEG